MDDKKQLGTPDPLVQADQFGHASIEQRETTGLTTKNDVFGNCKPENLKLLQRLIAIYVPKQRMKKPDKDLAKTILSLRQGHDGDKVICIYPQCGKVVDIIDAELHHYDGIESHNKVLNLGPIHHNCHSSLHGNQRSATKRLLLDRLGQPERERQKTSGAGAGPGTGVDLSDKEYNSREGEKHDLMRVRWNTWIHDRIKGPFTLGTEKWRPGALAKKAVHALGMGSSITYRRYVEEDYYGGVLDYELDDAGYRYVRYLGPKKDKTNPV